jgi:hypothetical protein
MNKAIIMMALAAVAVFATPVIVLQTAYAQGLYGGGAGSATPEQLQQCEELGIDRNECNDTTILAKNRLIYAQQNPATGSGTPMLSTESGQMAVFIGILGAIFGGVAAAFFFKGRGAKQVST